MALDYRIPLQAQGLNLEPPVNALQRAMGMQQMRQQNALRQMQMQQMQAAAQQQLAERQKAAEQEAALKAAISRIPSPRLAPLGGNAAPTVANAQRLGNPSPQVQSMWEMLQAAPSAKGAESYLAAAYPSVEIKDYKEVRMPDGSVQIVGFTKDGKPVQTGSTPFKAPEVRDFGGYVGGIDQITGKVSKYGDKTMSAADKDASARGWAGVNLQRDRLAFDKSKPATGAGGGAPTGEERKAATLLQRLRGSQAQLSAALETSPDAAKPEVSAEMLRRLPFVGGDTPANLVTSEARQQVEAAQLDMLDAALTLGTGAAYTREQLEGYRKSYFPQIGDDKKTVKDKQDRLQNVIRAAEIAAGRAEAQVPKAGGSITVDY